MSLLSSYNALENKLERHEQRERALGDVIKRGLQQLQKGQRIFEPMRGSFARLDERLSQMETMLLSHEAAQKEQKDKLNDTLTKVETLMTEHDEKDTKKFAEIANIIAKKQTKATDSEDELGRKIEDLSDSIKRMRQELGELATDRETSDLSNKELIAQTERLVNMKLVPADEVVAKVEEKFNSFYITGPATTTAIPIPLQNTEWENSVKLSLSTIEGSLKDLRSVAPAPKANELDKDFFATLTNNTLEAIEDMRIEVLAASDKSTTKTSIRIKEATTKLDTSISEVLRSLNDVTPSVDSITERVNKGFTDLHTDIAALGKLETILLTTSDSVMQIKRGLEFNKHTIKEEIGELIRKHIDSIDLTLSTQFGMMNETIYANHNGAMTNLTQKIEEEISMVWRQIGIMSNEVQMSKSSLNKLNEQTETYVNGTFATMDGMGGKVTYNFVFISQYFILFYMLQVTQITERMAEVDSNLNYLLGRLSLVTQEFNQIKEGLGSALDNIKSSFQIVQSKIESE